jgi:hypothetical protein
MPNFIRITINGNPYRVEENIPVSAADIRRRLKAKKSFRNLKGLDTAKVEYHKFLQKTWKPVGKGLRFKSGMAFRVLVRSRRGCRIVKTDRGMAFVCKRGG